MHDAPLDPRRALEGKDRLLRLGLGVGRQLPVVLLVERAELLDLVHQVLGAEEVLLLLCLDLVPVLLYEWMFGGLGNGEMSRCCVRTVEGREIRTCFEKLCRVFGVVL